MQNTACDIANIILPYPTLTMHFTYIYYYLGYNTSIKFYLTMIQCATLLRMQESLHIIHILSNTGIPHVMEEMHSLKVAHDVKFFNMSIIFQDASPREKMSP